ncbi:hypothetical protein BDR07DRAFT_1428292 [Suillus spraguei]|nr:hypothetical protein BDR07DRAFT_1428292 [Suillus spraguei]
MQTWRHRAGHGSTLPATTVKVEKVSQGVVGLLATWPIPSGVGGCATRWLEITSIQLQTDLGGEALKKLHQGSRLLSQLSGLVQLLLDGANTNIRRIDEQRAQSSSKASNRRD